MRLSDGASSGGVALQWRTRGLLVAAIAWVITAAAAVAIPPVETVPVTTPTVAPASEEGKLAIAGFKVPDGLTVKLWAAEPLLANPVAFCVDERGRAYVCETFRLHRGVHDNRGHMDWLDDDLAAVSVDDRLEYLKKRIGEKLDDYMRYEDRLVRIEDTDGDGTADSSTVFAGGFRDVLDGLGSGVIARGGDVWFTNIPHLWKLRDTDDDGVADERQSLHRGYGVRFSFIGHDLHGLCFGPDGKLYFSIGDRGINVKSAEGREFVYPDEGTVLRCEPDGSELEVVARGFRNPQELAFDQYGCLFTGDNNSDSGDKARWVYVVEGGDSGWRMPFQYLGDRGPWNREHLWHPAHPGQAAYIVPPILNLADGPSGLSFYPGVGLPDQYANHFFLCDFRGTPANSGVRSFAVKPVGASYEVVNSQEFLWSILVTDVDFASDGSMWVSDWVEGWNGLGKGRLYRVVDERPEVVAAARQVKDLYAAGFESRSLDELAALLRHPHQGIRRESQFTLASRGGAAIPVFAAAARPESPQLTRIHAVWGLGQIARRNSAVRDAALEQVRPLLADADPELRAQSARVLGEAKDAAAFDGLVSLLADASQPRGQFFAAIALGKLGRGEVLPSLVEMLRTAGENDAYLRHAAVMGIVGTQSADTVGLLLAEPSLSVRLAAVVALRRMSSPLIAAALVDADSLVVDEAARAIHDVPIPQAMPAVAALAGLDQLSESTLRRVIAANFRIGGAPQAEAVVRIAATPSLPEAMRVEALQALGDWGFPSGRDRVLGFWRPVPSRSGDVARVALLRGIGGLFSGPEAIQRAATDAAVKLGITEVGPQVFAIAFASNESAETRAAALLALDSLNDSRLKEAIEKGSTDTAPAVRAAALQLRARHDGDAALGALQTALETGTVIERQAAFAALSMLKSTAADHVLREQFARLVDRTLPAAVTLDLLDAVSRRDNPVLRAAVAEWDAARSEAAPVVRFAETLEGGDADAGRRVFFERSEASCVRCHKIDDRGGDVGPNLTRIGSQKTREYLLEAIVDPNKAIAEGFDSVIVETESGLVHGGVLKRETESEIELMTSDGLRKVIPKSEIVERLKGISAMPEDLSKKITKRDIRDLVEYLSRLK
jgi:quinoprotein glucose dehydrogenase